MAMENAEPDTKTGNWALFRMGRVQTAAASVALFLIIIFQRIKYSGESLTKLCYLQTKLKISYVRVSK